MYRVNDGLHQWQTPRQNSVIAIIRGRKLMDYSLSARVDASGEYVPLLTVREGKPEEISERLTGYGMLNSFYEYFYGRKVTK